MMQRTNVYTEIIWNTGKFKTRYLFVSSFKIMQLEEKSEMEDFKIIMTNRLIES